MIPMKRKHIPPTMAECIAVCGDPQTWKGKCHVICTQLVAGLGLGIRQRVATRYGIYLGPIHKASMFHGKPVVRHGWMEVTRTKMIIDPTRWVFENANPYIFYGDGAGLYDLGGGTLRNALLMGDIPPDIDADMERIDINIIDMPEAGQKLVIRLFGTSAWVFNRTQVQWLVNLPIEQIGVEAARDIYRHVAKYYRHGKALIPIDYWHAAFGDDPPR